MNARHITIIKNIAIYAMVGGITIAYASYACKVFAPANCNEHLVSETVSGPYTCTLGLVPHDVVNGSSTIIAPVSTRPWYGHAESGSLNKNYYSVTCKWTSAVASQWCPLHYAAVWAAVMVPSSSEDAVNLTGTCPPQ